MAGEKDALFTWGGEEYEFAGSVNSLNEDDLNEKSDDYFYDLLSLYAIEAAMGREEVGSLNLERVQTLLKNNNYSIIHRLYNSLFAKRSPLYTK